jgi:hypothetical protein
VFEIYTNADAYKTSGNSAFQEFRATTKKMVKSRELIDAEPIALAAKEKRARRQLGMLEIPDSR